VAELGDAADLKSAGPQGPWGFDSPPRHQSERVEMTGSEGVWQPRTMEGVTVQTLKVVRQTFTMLSEKRTQVIDITKQIRDIMLSADIKEGILLVNSLHTTCALFVNEFQGALVEDLKAMLERLVADNGGYKHDDPRYSDCERGNASSHLRAAVLGRSVALGISGGELSLGRFQSILFAELDGPRSRSIDIQIMGV
jgi:secondary thiamine-phosphate synthase enzyme